jgi:hypothetical protein
MTDSGVNAENQPTQQSTDDTITWQLASGPINIVLRDGVCYVNGSPVTPASAEKEKQ